MLQVLFVALTFLLSQECHAAPKPALRVGTQIQDKVEDLQTEVDNHTTEIRIIEEKLQNQVVILESIRDQFQDTNQSQKDFVKNSSVSLENRILSLESTIKSITNDLKQMQTHSNETANALKQYKQKIADQGTSIETLQKAMNTLLEAMQINAAATTKAYTVQSGDTLEKIAKKQKTTVKELTQLNGLQGEKIFIGQTLRLP